MRVEFIPFYALFVLFGWLCLISLAYSHAHGETLLNIPQASNYILLTCLFAILVAMQGVFHAAFNCRNVDFTDVLSPQLPNASKVSDLCLRAGNFHRILLGKEILMGLLLPLLVVCTVTSRIDSGAAAFDAFLISGVPAAFVAFQLVGCLPIYLTKYKSIDVLNTQCAYLLIRLCLFLEAAGIADCISLLLELYVYRRSVTSLLPRVPIEGERDVTSVCNDYLKYITLVSPVEVTSLESVTRCCEVLRGTLKRRFPSQHQHILRRGLRLCNESSCTYSILRPWHQTDDIYTSAATIAAKLRRDHKPVPRFLSPKSHSLYVPPHLVVMGGILQLGQIGKQEQRGYRPIPV